MSRSRHPPPEQVTPLLHGGTFLPVVLKEQRFLGHRQPFPHDVCYLSAPRPRDSAVNIRAKPGGIGPVVCDAVGNRGQEEPDLVTITSKGLEYEFQPHDFHEKRRIYRLSGLAINPLHHLHERNETSVAFLVLGCHQGSVLLGIRIHPSCPFRHAIAAVFSLKYRSYFVRCNIFITVVDCHHIVVDIEITPAGREYVA